MPRRIAMSELNGRTVDILNTIRANASEAYQSSVPVINDANNIPKVGEAIWGYPALANEFLTALVNRIALVRVQSATFNNAYKELKKGFLEFGETVEDVFVGIAKAREFSAEKAAAREFKRTIPDVKAAFHTMNWKVQYPLTIQQEDLKRAFLSANGVTDLIARLVGSLSTAAEYDEYLLFKYLIIKAVAHGKMKPVAFDATEMKNAAKTFRGTSNALEFISTEYNAAGVHTNTAKANQYIFMDAQFNADYDVDVLAAAFNMDKATFTGHLKLIDSFTTFDNERFDVVREGCDGIEEVTDAELALMADVKAVLVDEEWFQVYDNLDLMTEQQVASGLYWNYFYNVWKIVSSSPFSNAVVFVDDGASIAVNNEYTFTVINKTTGAENVILSIALDDTTASLAPSEPQFVQGQDAVEDGIAVHKYGTFIFPDDEDEVLGECYIGGTKYVSCTKSTEGGTTTYTETNIAATADVGDEILFCKESLITA